MPITLRPVTLDDLPLLVGGESPYDDFGPRSARTEPYAPALHEPGGLAVCEGEELLGNVSWVWQRWGPNPPSTNPMIGIWLRPSARGRGAGTRAQRLLVDLFFRHTPTHRVEAATDVDNTAEQRALERVGFVHEGTVRGAQWRDGAYRDQRLYSILREEWQPL